MLLLVITIVSHLDNILLLALAIASPLFSLIVDQICYLGGIGPGIVGHRDIGGILAYSVASFFLFLPSSTRSLFLNSLGNFRLVGWQGVGPFQLDRLLIPYWLVLSLLN